MKRTFELNDWDFEIESLGFKKQVTLPHTWNVDENDSVALYRGAAKYKTALCVPPINGGTAVLYFGCAYNTAKVFINGEFTAEHKGSGSTPFEIDVTKKLKVGENLIEVIADNTPHEDMLPYILNFDWADDGGLTRNVTLTLYEENDLRDLRVSYEISSIHGEACDGVLKVFATGTPQAAEIEISDSKTGETALCEKLFFKESAELNFTGLKLWDINSPALYLIKLKFEGGEALVKTGFRTVEILNSKVLLNKKEIFLKGCEWMPGSHPDYGMAEPLSHSEMRLAQLKEAGCVFTRFHWQQDTSLFDWCDENGLLVQEEIPYWGAPKDATEKQLAIAKAQADDMVHFHAHHPSIICWGVGNELGGSSKKTIKYVDEMYKYFKSLDKSRLVNYVSNSVQCRNRLVRDATLHGDIAMWNDYMGLWMACKEKNIEKEVRKTAAYCGKKPLLISEFGLCEPFFKGGDERRCEILKQRVAIYKTLPNAIGYMWFSLNDYRTQCGEESTGRMRRRVHGSTDIYGNIKPSYLLLKDC